MKRKWWSMVLLVGVNWLISPVVINGKETDFDGSKLISCCQLCRSVFNEDPNRISNCSYENSSKGNIVQCGKLDSTTGLHLNRFSCDDWTHLTFSQCSNAKVPKLNCHRYRNRDSITLKCWWLHFPLTDERDCFVSLSWPMLFSNDLQSGYVPVQEPICDKKQCSVIFAYPKKDDQSLHCPSDKISFTAYFGKTGNRANFIYELNRLEGNLNRESIKPQIVWTHQNNDLMIRFSFPSSHTKDLLCSSMEPNFTCHLESVDDTNETILSLHSPMQFSDNDTDSDEDTHSRTFCHFGQLPENSSRLLLSLKSSSNAYQSEKFIIFLESRTTKVLSTTELSVEDEIVRDQAPMSVLAIAACVLAFPVFCGLIFCVVWARRHCKSPCTLYKACVAKRKLRRTADWVVSVQTHWLQKENQPSGIQNMDFQPSTPASSLTTPEGVRSDRSVHWHELIDPDQDELAPSLKRPLMQLTKTDLAEVKQIDSPESTSLATDTWFSDVYKSAESELIDPDRSKLRNISNNWDSTETDHFYCENDENDLPQDDEETELSELVKFDQRVRKLKSDDEISFVTALDVDPRTLETDFSVKEDDMGVKKTLVQIV